MHVMLARVPNIQVKNVPDDIHKVWKHRAVAAGQSLQEYLLAKLIEDAGVPTREEWMETLKSRSGGRAPTELVVQMIREDRDSH